MTSRRYGIFGDEIEEACRYFTAEIAGARWLA
jgi:hypothetical protein